MKKKVKNPNNAKTEQAKRVIYIFKELLKSRKMTVLEMKQELIHKFGIDISLRSVQRDFKLLQDAIPVLEQFKEGKAVFWRMSPIFKNPSNFMFVESNELLSFHLLKAHLKTFRGTLFEDDTYDLQSKLEQLAPGEVFLDDSFYWDQNAGQFDYSGYDKTLRLAIDAIINKRWVRVKYHSVKLNTEKEYDVFFCGLFVFSGTLYVVTYFHYFDNYEALALQGIKSILPAKRSYEIHTKFDFHEFTKRRFGVYSGKTFKVKLLIEKQYKGYFEHRTWHSTQRTRETEDGDLIIEMFVPIGMDLVGWILSWHKIVKVLGPRQLKEKVLEKAKSILDQYEESCTNKNDLTGENLDP
jgi:predicted DNA-binding transcriptional regulator YafY